MQINLIEPTVADGGRMDEGGLVIRDRGRCGGSPVGSIDTAHAVVDPRLSGSDS